MAGSTQSKPLRGLVYLWVIAFVVMVAAIFRGLIAVLPPVSPDIWAMGSPASSSYHPLMKPFLLFELASRTALLCGSILVAYAFLRRRRHAPGRIMIFLVAYMGVLLIEQSMTYIMIVQKFGEFLAPGRWYAFGTKEFLYILGSCLVWLPLFARSVRLKALFVH